MAAWTAAVRAADASAASRAALAASCAAWDSVLDCVEVLLDAPGAAGLDDTALGASLPPPPPPQPASRSRMAALIWNVLDLVTMVFTHQARHAGGDCRQKAGRSSESASLSPKTGRRSGCNGYATMINYVCLRMLSGGDSRAGDCWLNMMGGVMAGARRMSAGRVTPPF